MTGAKMLELNEKAAQLGRLNEKVSRLFQRNLDEAIADSLQVIKPIPLPAHSPQQWWQSGVAYWQDSLQRQALFWDILRQRGDQFLQHEADDKPPVLKFEYEIVVDARHFAHPVNYALAKITPPAGHASVDPHKRPYVIIDPRAGHGPGIGGFKKDSEIGVALQAGHPVYAVIFFPHPEPGQTMADVTQAEQAFLRFVNDEHPQAPKPVLIGNCQGGWAALLVASISPDLVGAVVSNGAPVSYWAGNEKNPMRYSGGMLGGSWPALLAADLGKGKFDGAHLVSNFENLDLGNTLVSKLYHLYDKVDTEAPRFLDFERWWGANYLMNEQEIRWIVENLFIGNNLVEGTAKAKHGFYDLKAIHAPIVVFASMGDNITPPQQAFNWILDLYPTTEALKAAGQVVVGLVHQDIGHLGIFVSAGVAKKEHAQIVELMTVIETLSPGLYALNIHPDTAEDGSPQWRAELSERRVEDLHRVQRFDRQEEVLFSSVEAVSEFNTQLYTTLVRPLIKPLISDWQASVSRALHPLSLQRWSWSSLNPLANLNSIAADQARSQRQAAAADNPWRELERAITAQVAHSLDFVGKLRDISTEALFMLNYGALTIAGVGAEHRQDQPDQAAPIELDLEALKAQLGVGGYADGLVRLGLLLQNTESIPLSRRQFSIDWLKQQPELANLTPEQLWQIIQQQSQLVWQLPEEALQTLPSLLGNATAVNKAFKVFSQLLTLLPDDTQDLADKLAQLRAALPSKPRARTSRKASTPA
jgi:pimeloyl-ACP methyl ester carboxylesterase